MIAGVKKKLELIAPAGNMECARAAVANGADAVYFGLEKFNARMRADNFTEEQLPGLVRFLHEHGLRAFCTVNALIFTDGAPRGSGARVDPPRRGGRGCNYRSGSWAGGAGS